MMEIKWSDQIIRNYKRRIAKNEKLREAFWEAIEAFMYDPNLVNDHELEGKMAGQRAFSVTSDYRIVYRKTSEHILLLDVGTHEQVYLR